LEGNQPRRNEIHATRKKACLKDTKKHTKPDHSCPLLRESKADHHSTPREGNGRKEWTRADLAAEHSRWWLEDDIGYEEYERDDVLHM